MRIAEERGSLKLEKGDLVRLRTTDPSDGVDICERCGYEILVFLLGR
jgi:hypothetical protein